MAGTPSTLTYLADAERRGALGHATAHYFCNCDICHPRPFPTTENTENPS